MKSPHFKYAAECYLTEIPQGIKYWDVFLSGKPLHCRVMTGWPHCVQAQLFSLLLMFFFLFFFWGMLRGAHIPLRIPEQALAQAASRSPTRTQMSPRLRTSTLYPPTKPGHAAPPHLYLHLSAASIRLSVPLWHRHRVRAEAGQREVCCQLRGPGTMSYAVKEC